MGNAFRHVFLIGAKSIGAYGGYETFVNKLTEYHQYEKRIQYHIAVKENGLGSMNPSELNDVNILSENEFIYHNAHCFKVKVPDKIGSAQAIYYDVMALEKACEIVVKENIRDFIVYIMACRIGPFMRLFYNKVHKLGGKVYLNPDGHEWKRAKWSAPVKKYWKLSESLMVKYSDLVICDSVNIEKYILDTYQGQGLNGETPKTTFIAYGAETRKSKLTDDDSKFINWLNEKRINIDSYYLVVGRFVPENNYETIIREFMKSKSEKDLVIITNANGKLMETLESELTLSTDSRIKFVGTVYDQELLMKIRENAYGYIHGHEVGGTNPSLLEALGSTKLNLLLDVCFNKEVGKDSALYWNKESGNLSSLINKCDNYDYSIIDSYDKKSRERIKSAYSWEYITKRYAKLWD